MENNSNILIKIKSKEKIILQIIRNTRNFIYTNKYFKNLIENNQ